MILPIYTYIYIKIQLDPRRPARPASFKKAVSAIPVGLKCETR
jgi:hypothetical protein